MDLFDLRARISLDTDDYELGVDKAGGAMNKLSAMSVAAGNLIADGIRAGGRALLDFGKQAIGGYAEQEQLIGGVETLFKDSSDTILKYAENAYKTAGLSSNEYMETVTSFSASLLQSLDGDTAKAAEKADLAITDMSDNANKMGTSMEMIQNAYNGFAKQNFTMLDNLKLGYGGTKEEMQRLIEHAASLKDVQAELGVTVDANSMSYSNIVDAIHVVQAEMGIMGATYEEASKTIDGSMKAAKTAWQNLVTGIASGNADIDLLLNNFIESAGTAAGNLLPAIGNVLANLGAMLEERGPELVVEGVKLLGNMAVGVIRGIPDFISKVPEVIMAFVQEFKESGPEFAQIGKDIVMGIWTGISALASWLREKVSSFVNGIVGSVKGVLGIHSPSRVFAGIGENMALGLGEGWGNEYGSVKSTITKGLEFGTASIDFASSALAKSSAGIVGSIMCSNDRETVINLTTTIDGEVLARKLYIHNEKEQLRRGTAFA